MVSIGYYSGSYLSGSYQVAIRKLPDNRKLPVDCPKAIGYLLYIE